MSILCPTLSKAFVKSLKQAEVSTFPMIYSVIQDRF